MANAVGTTPIRLTALRSIQLLDERILVQSWRRDALPAGADDYIDLTTKDIFDNTYDSTLYRATGKDADMEYFAKEQHDSQFQTDDMSDDQIVAYFLPLGLDFRDDRGHPLRCTIFIARQAEAAVKGISGRLPETTQAEQRSWEENLPRDASKFMRDKAQRRVR